MESLPNNQAELPSPDIEDFANTSYYSHLRKIPEALIEKHLIYIERNNLSEEEATEYVAEVLNRRTEALTETVISDPGLLEKIRNQKEDIFHHLETDVFSSQENYLGSGMTAKVKYFEITDEASGETLPLAIKYLLTPTSMTLSASKEHDMLFEVERIQQIETIEADANLNFIKVPHPYFHHQNEQIQCYGMELVDGFDLSKELVEMRNGEDKENLVKKLASMNFAEIEKEIDIFYNRMHEYCLHGDMKPANMMVNKEGKFYIIDFGQSRLINDIPDKAQEQLYTLIEDEIRITKNSIRKILSDAQALVAQR